ncbi:MAG: haloacid dehalogenase-like hydrolase [Dehalococcoidia bacterium]
MTTTVLFDVDQTLLYTGGAGSLAMARAFHQLYGVEDGFKNVEYSGRTDWSILKQGLEHHGLLGGINGGFADEIARFVDVYKRLLPAALDEREGHLKPGIVELLQALVARDDVAVGLATGNFRVACMTKLRYFGIQDYLTEGGFGDDAEDRGDMVAVAIGRVSTRRVSGAPGPNSVWIIGDTPLDIDAARANGARSLAVATGSSSVDELRAAGADLALSDLSATEEVLHALLD